MRFDGQALYQLRLRRDMSRADLATAVRSASDGRIKATERGVRGWEKNEYVPRGEALAAIATALGCDVPTLFGAAGVAGDEDEESSGMPLTRDEFTLLGDLMGRLGATISIGVKPEAETRR